MHSLRCDMWRLRLCARCTTAPSSMQWSAVRLLSSRPVPTTASALRALMNDDASAAMSALAVPLSRAVPAVRGPQESASFARMSPEAKAAREEYLLKEAAAKVARERAADKAMLIERARRLREAAEQVGEQEERAATPTPPRGGLYGSMLRERPGARESAAAAAQYEAAVSHAASPAQQPYEGDDFNPRQTHAEWQEARLPPLRTMPPLQPRRQSAPLPPRPVTPPPPPPPAPAPWIPEPGGPSPFKRFDPFFDYTSALQQVDAEGVKKLEQERQQQRMQREKRQRQIREMQEEEEQQQQQQETSANTLNATELSKRELQLQRTREGRERAKRGLPKMAKEDSVYAPSAAESSAGSVRSTSAPPASRSVTASSAAIRDPASFAAQPAIKASQQPSQPRPASRAEQQHAAASWGTPAERVPTVAPSAAAPVRAAELFRRPDAPAKTAAATAADQTAAKSPSTPAASTDAASAAPASASAAAEPAKPSRRQRGPASAAAALAANKFPLDRELAAQEERKRRDEAAAAAAVAREQREAKKLVALRQERLRLRQLIPDKDGKLPLQPLESTLRPPTSIPSHPALYLRNFLAKIHPDLFHQEQQQQTSSGLPGQKAAPTAQEMVSRNQETVAKFNAIVDYYKAIKLLPPSTRRIPPTPVMPTAPDTLSFYCRVKVKPTAAGAASATAASAEPLPSAEDDSNAPTTLQLFTASFSPSPFDLSSLSRLLGYLDTLFMRLLLAAQAGVHESVRARWAVQMRARLMEQDLWAKGEDTAGLSASAAYLTRDPTEHSLSQSPGRAQSAYLSYFAQTSEAHAQIRAAQGVRVNAPNLYAPGGENSNPLSPLLEAMLRAGLLRFDPLVDMLQRLECLQRLRAVLHAPDAHALYPHLWLGVRVNIGSARAPSRNPEEAYRYSADEWNLPWDLEPRLMRRMVAQYLYAYHADAAGEGVARLEQKFKAEEEEENNQQPGKKHSRRAQGKHMYKQ